MFSEILMRLIKRFEGLRLKAYLCPAGVWTIGYGSTAYPDGRKIKPGDQVSEPVAEAMAQQDAAVFLQAACNLSPILYMDENKQAAIGDFCYNLGTSRYKVSTLRRRVNSGDWEGAAEELQKWVWGGGKKLPGLVLRRQVEAALLR
jgi:lysozyme